MNGFNEWWKTVNTNGLPNRVICKMAFEAGRKSVSVPTGNVGDTLRHAIDRALDAASPPHADADKT